MADSPSEQSHPKPYLRAIRTFPQSERYTAFSTVAQSGERTRRTRLVGYWGQVKYLANFQPHSAAES